eukprot:gene3290-2272_t
MRKSNLHTSPNNEKSYHQSTTKITTLTSNLTHMLYINNKPESNTTNPSTSELQITDPKSPAKQRSNQQQCKQLHQFHRMNATPSVTNPQKCKVFNTQVEEQTRVRQTLAQSSRIITINQINKYQIRITEESLQIVTNKLTNDNPNTTPQRQIAAYKCIPFSKLDLYSANPNYPSQSTYSKYNIFNGFQHQKQSTNVKVRTTVTKSKYKSYLMWLCHQVNQKKSNTKQIVQFEPSDNKQLH